jgi:hypothetical protein
MLAAHHDEVHRPSVGVKHDDLGGISMLLDRLRADARGFSPLAKFRRASEPLLCTKREWLIGRDGVQQVQLGARRFRQRQCALEGGVSAVRKIQCDENPIVFH